MMRWFANALLFVAVAAFSTVPMGLAQDATKSTAETNKKDTNKSVKETSKSADAKGQQHTPHPFVGVLVGPVHPALADHLGDLLNAEQGLIVEESLPDSPAAKAGIKTHDILTMYDDQKLFSAEQFAKLVHSDKIGREVTIGYLRGGKQEKAQIKLGEAPKNPEAEGTHHAWHPRWFNHPRAFFRHVSHNPKTQWDDFDSLTLKKLGDNKFRAEVQYLNTSGKTEKHVFEGTREEIKKDIDAEKDLKPEERDHLLRSLNLPNDMEDFPDEFDAF
jgi:membrane-associated protease RseP (regulator of RpoE activity)